MAKSRISDGRIGSVNFPPYGSVYCGGREPACASTGEMRMLVPRQLPVWFAAIERRGRSDSWAETAFLAVR